MSELWLNMAVCLKKKGQSTVITGIGMSRHRSYSNGEWVQSSWDLVLRRGTPRNLTTQTRFDLWTQTIHHQIWSKVRISPRSTRFFTRFFTTFRHVTFCLSISGIASVKQSRPNTPTMRHAPRSCHGTIDRAQAPRLQRRANLCWHLLLEDLYLSTLTAIVI